MASGTTHTETATGITTYYSLLLLQAYNSLRSAECALRSLPFCKHGLN